MTPALAVYFGLILTRVATFVAVMPLFSGRTPQTVRAALALVLTIFWFSSVSPGWDERIAQQASDVHWFIYTLSLLREAVIGVILGFAFSLFLLPAQIAGEFVTSQIGLALSQQTGLSSSAQASPLAVIFEAAASLVFLEIDGHHVILTALHASFTKLPLGGVLLPMPAGPMLDGLSNAQQMGLLLAGPLGLCLFLLAVTLAIMARAAPQLNIYSVGFTLQVVVALVGGMFLMPDMVQLMTVFLSGSGASIGRFLE